VAQEVILLLVPVVSVVQRPMAVGAVVVVGEVTPLLLLALWWIWRSQFRRKLCPKFLHWCVTRRRRRWWCFTI
jgi:hypothetical protein